MAKKESKKTAFVMGNKIQQLENAIQKRISKKIQKLVDFWLVGYPAKASVSINVAGSSFCTNKGTIKSIVIGLVNEWVSKLSVWVLEYIVIPYLAEHETDHARWTDDNFATAIELAMKRINEIAEGEELVVHQQALASICHKIANIIEDGRIELIDSRENPGFDRSRNYFRGKLWEWAYEDDVRHGFSSYSSMEAGEKMNNILNNLLTLATMYELPTDGKKAKVGCYNKGWLDHYRGTDMHDTIKECKPWLMTGVNGAVCADIVVPTVKIAELLWLYMRDSICIGREDFEAIRRLVEELHRMMEEDECNMGKADPETSKPSKSRKKSTKSEEKDEGEGEENGETSAEQEENGEISEDSKGTGKGEESESEEDKEEGDGESDGESDKSDEEAEKDNNSGEDKGEGEDSPKNPASTDMKTEGSKGNELSDEFDFDSKPDDTEDGDEENSDADAKQSAKNQNTKEQSEAQADRDRMMERDANSLEDALAGVYDDDDYTDFEEVMASRRQMHSITNDARIQGNKLKRFFENYLRNKSTPNRVNLVSGKVNTSQITKVCIGEQNYFKQMGQPWKPDCAFYILLDDSGSMSGSKREYAARQCSALEFGIPTGVPFKITAFDVHGNVRHRVIKDWDDQKKGNISFSESWLYNEPCGGGNKDGYSIRVAAHELLQRQEKKKMLIILSDGEPTDYKGGSSHGYRDVREAVENARKQGLDVVAIFFGDDAFIRNSAKHYDYMYQKDYIGVNPQNIFPELEKVLKKLLR